MRRDNHPQRRCTNPPFVNQYYRKASPATRATLYSTISQSYDRRTLDISSRDLTGFEIPSVAKPFLVDDTVVD